MVAKREIDKSTETFELQLTHADIVDMMNDPDVLIDAGTVSSSQELEAVVRRLSGAENVLSKFGPDDTLVLRFRKTEITDNTTTFGGVDLS